MSLDDGLPSGPWVAAGMELRYTGLKLVDRYGAAWAAVYAEDGTLWQFPAADMIYCAVTGKAVALLTF